MKLSQGIALFTLLANASSVNSQVLKDVIIPRSNVDSHAMIDLDIKDMREALEKGDFGTANSIYTNGKNSQKYDSDGNPTSLRTLQKFSTAAGATDNKFAEEPAFWFHVWGINGGAAIDVSDHLTYADQFVMKTLRDTSSGTLAAEAALVLNTWMYIAHEIYDAVTDCEAGERSPDAAGLTDNGLGVKAIDEAAAFWVGSEQRTGLATGHSMFEVSQQVDNDFGTLSTVSKANEAFADIFEAMQTVISAGGCRPNTAEKASVKLYHLGNRMISVMMVPLMKKLLHSILVNDTDLIKLYALSVVPQLFACKVSHARMLMLKLYQNDYNPSDEADVISMLQQSYSCLGFKCGDIGSFGAMQECVDDPDIVALAGYMPTSDVKQMARIDLDMLQMKILTRVDASRAGLRLYQHGKNSEVNRDNFEYNTMHVLATRKDRDTANPFFEYFKTYNGEDKNYADSMVFMALTDNGRFEKMSTIQRAEFIYKGIEYQVGYMAALTEFSQSFEKCSAGKTTASAHHWDKGVAILIGSVEGTEIGGSPTSDGIMFYNLANKRCQQWGTCDSSGTNAKIIQDYMMDFSFGKDAALASQCDDIIMARDKLAHDLQIPLMQATLRYAIKCQGLTAGDPIKDLSEGEIFANSVLPMVAAYNPDSASLIATNMVMDPNTVPVADGPQAVADAFTSVIKDFGRTCRDIGADADSGVNACGAGVDIDSMKSSSRAQSLFFAYCFGAVVLLLV